MSLDLNTAGLREIGQALRDQTVSSVELSKAYLARIAASNLNAFLHVDDELTIRHAKAADAQRSELLKAGDAQALAARPLLGVPLAHKDIFVTQDWRSTAGSKMLANYTSPFNATVVAKLAAQGMVCLGKASCDEFAMGSGNENPWFGAVKNPWDTSRIPGGSSGGSAAAVAAGLTPIATGTDTGGSVRQPAAMCGITGIKPTYGRVSRFGMIAFASSLDQAGVLARSAEDCATVLEAMMGFDERDSTSVQRSVDALSPLSGGAPWLKSGQTTRDPARPLAGLRIGIPKEFFSVGLAAEVKAAIDKALAEMVEQGAVLVEISLPKTELAIPAYYVIAPAEASSNLSRFDGVRYGHRAEGVTDLASLYNKSRSEGFGAEVKRRILIGAYVLSHGYYDAYYLKAQRLRRLIAEDFAAAFEKVDVIAGPVSPTTAWKIGEQTDDPVKNYLADVYTLPASLAGLPGMSVPVGFGAGNLPIGMQLIGNYFDEAGLLRVAHEYQRLTQWHRAVASKSSDQNAG
jgi:aspartyl-tRNA(Asn)/glutamyl-tRNA(Gln) amidotransferase subunit A